MIYGGWYYATRKHLKIPATRQRAEYIRACTGFGTVVDYSIVLRPRGDEKRTTLVEHDRLYYQYPKFRWINDDTLSVDLGKVNWLSSPIHKLSSVNISYVTAWVNREAAFGSSRGRRASNTFYAAYKHASNYAVGIERDF